MLVFIHTAAAWSAIIVVAIFITLYTKSYNWHKHRLGLVMNLSLISAALTAGGGILRNHAESAGLVVSALGWFTFAALLAWRLRLLQDSRDDISPEDKG